VAQDQNTNPTDTPALIGALLHATVELAVWGAILYALIAASV
jgi:hypothetical protein